MESNLDGVGVWRPNGVQINRPDPMKLRETSICKVIDLDSPEKCFRRRRFDSVLIAHRPYILSGLCRLEHASLAVFSS